MSKTPDRIETFAAFWPYYLGEHRNPYNRGLHYTGTTLAICWLIATVVMQYPWFLIGAPLSGYGFAWVGHFFVEKNRPATFTYPFYSLFADFTLYFMFVSCRLSSDPDFQRICLTYDKMQGNYEKMWHSFYRISLRSLTYDFWRHFHTMSCVREEL